MCDDICEMGEKHLKQLLVLQHSQKRTDKGANRQAHTQLAIAAHRTAAQ